MPRSESCYLKEVLDGDLGRSAQDAGVRALGQHDALHRLAAQGVDVVQEQLRRHASGVERSQACDQRLSVHAALKEGLQSND